jgi:hypothetical protein
MKVLVKDKIVESYHFPFTEALNFSILVWTIWGLAEAFYWHRLAPWLNPAAQTVDSSIYMEAFLLYVCLAAVFAFFSYSVVKISVVALELHESYRFRSITLSLILLLFFFPVLNYYLPNHLFTGAFSNFWKYGLASLLILFATVVTFVLLKWASGVEFRLRRSGTMMLSVLTASLILSFVHFPIFSSDRDRGTFSFHPQLESIRNLTIYYYLKPLVEKRDPSAVVR